MMHDLIANFRIRTRFPTRWMLTLALFCAASANAGTVAVDVVDATGAPLGNGIRWLLEEDATFDIDPNNPPANKFDSALYQLHKSYMPVSQKGESNSASFTIADVDETKRYYLSILPNLADSDCGSGGGGDCYTMSGTPVRFEGATDTTARIIVTPQPLPSAQARVRVFDDRGLINNFPDPGEGGLGDFVIILSDHGGGPLVTDNLGNPLGTTYDVNGEVALLGDGTFHTMNETDVDDPLKNPLGLAVGEVQIQNIAPGKYGIQAIPPAGEGWQQTTTIEGSNVIDAWVRAGEPTFAVEFGPTLAHAFFGMVKEFSTLDGTNTVTGTVTNLRMQRPPNPEFLAGEELGNCWVALNDSNGVGRYAAACPDSGSSFSIPNVPDGTYNLIVWDRYMLNIINFNTVIVDGADVDIPLGAIAVPRWFATQEHYVFNDLNGNGIRDIDPATGEPEPGLPEQAINLRYRDGSIYAASATDLDGYLPLEQVFPFFSWLVAEVDFARFAATGVRVTIDDGGAVVGDPDDVLDPGNGLRNPQIQPGGQSQRVETINQCNGAPDCVDTGGPSLTEGYNSFAGTTHKFEWGKRNYQPGENGGISGIVFYQTTRAENDPRFAGAEVWEPGIPRVPVMLYRSDPGGVILDTNNSGGIELADIDHFPFGWSTGGAMGVEDIERSGADGVFDLGDAIEAASTDSWDDNIPDGCVGDTLAAVPGNEDLIGRCYDSLRNWSQVRSAVFDGGYGLGAPWSDFVLTSGAYVVEAVAPNGYDHQDELSKNVDFGDSFIPQALPPVCVGDPQHTGGQQAANFVPPGADLDLFAGVEVDPRFTGDRPFCNMKMVLVTDSKNTAADFFLYTDVPIAGHIQGNVLNDIGNATRADDPNFGEKIAAGNIPISIRDYADNEINRLYTDADGRYNGLVPSTYRINAPMASGVSPNMVRVCLNPATRTDPTTGLQIPEPFHDSRYSQTCFTFNFAPGQTTYLDTPVLPVAAFVDTPDWQLDCSYPDGTPVISYATTNANEDNFVGGPVIRSGENSLLSIFSAGTVQVADPALPRPGLVTRDFGFGDFEENASQVFLNGVELTNVNWGDGSPGNPLEVEIPGGMSTGQLEIVRANGLRSVHGLTVIVMDDPNDAIVVAGPAEGVIQAAIDAALPGDVVLVAPGNYNEPLIITKPIQLQGYGPGVTIINAGRGNNQDALIRWREDANRRTNCPGMGLDEIGLLPGQQNNVEGFTDPLNCGFRPETGLFVAEEMAGVLVAPLPNVFGTAPARIDGFTFTSADFSGGIIVNGYATGLEISNNIVRNNQGLSAGGIRIGQSDLFDENGELVDAENDNLSIHHNYITQNSSTFNNGGGLGLYNGTDNYNIWSNYICGNFSQGDGAGIAHYGRSPGGVIQNNKILFNQSFDQTATKTGGSGGGILIAGHPQPAAAAVPATAGSGSVKIIGNRIQGNQAGTGDGGGIALRSVNGQDLLISLPENRDSIEIFNNMVINNVAGLAAGGISLQDAVNVLITNNTIVNNDSTATVAAAFGIDPNFTEPQPAGVVARAHTPQLLQLGVSGIGQFSNPAVGNNIIMGNRSMHWEANAGGGFPAVPGLVVEVNPFRDLAVLGTGGLINARDNILSGDPNNALYNSRRNRLLSVAREDDLLATPYVNGPMGAAAPFDATQFGTPFLSGAAFDEGGNFISVLYGPLSPAGDYHLEAGSIAIDSGRIRNIRGINDLFADIDGDPRPVYSRRALQPDRGADEVVAVDPGVNVAPKIVSRPSREAQIGQQFSYQVIALDANPGDSLRYESRRCANRNQGWNNCTASSLGSNIDASTGLFTWTPNNGRARFFRVRVFDRPAGDNSGGFATQRVIVDPYRSRQPIAVNDPATNPNQTIQVTSMGQFVWAAPGVLGNDSTGNGNQGAEVLTPAVADQTALMVDTGGEVVLAPNGALILSQNDTWVGRTSFTYNVTDGVFPNPSAPATVRLRRRIAVTAATFTDGPGTTGDIWNVSGLAAELDGRTIFVDLSPSANGGGLIENLGSSIVAGGAWAITAAEIQPGNGRTITVRLANGTVLMQGVIPTTLFDGGSSTTSTSVFVQCAGDDDGDGIYSQAEQDAHPDIWCKHLAAGDGFIRMPDDREIYTFGFSDVSDQLPVNAISTGLLNAQFPAPSLVFKEGQEAYLTLTNVGTILRPDLFDPHTVHFHGFPNASAVFDGVPESSISINGGFSLTYYYNIVEPGTFMYHCHVEASEHMQMGMLGNLYVEPAQDGTLFTDPTDSTQYSSFVYNDGDGTTGYDVQVPIQIGSMDSNYHDEHLLVQPLPFAAMRDDYPMLNGRGYPHTADQGDIAPLPDGMKITSGVDSAAVSSQQVSALIEVQQGQRLLLRVSNLNVTQFSTLSASGLTMKVVGVGAHILRGPGGADLYYETSSVTLGGGEAIDVLIDTDGVTPGTYLLYSTNLNDLSNGTEDFGGMMTEIVITP